MVWSDKSTAKIAGYAAKVFFEELFKHADLITTDRQQTPNGRRFWFCVIDSALTTRLFVYYMDRNTKKVEHIGNKHDLERLSGEIWSELNQAMGHLVVISKEPIKERGPA